MVFLIENEQMTDDFLFKIACDKNGVKLGKIIRVEQLPGKTVKKEVPYAIIHVIKALRRDVKIPIALSKKLKAKGEHIWFDIDKKDFDDEVRKQRAIQRHMKATRKTSRERYWGF